MARGVVAERTGLPTSPAGRRHSSAVSRINLHAPSRSGVAWSPGVLRENEVHRVMCAKDDERHASIASLDEFLTTWAASAHGREIIRQAQSAAGARRLRVLDIGVADGESSFFLAAQGHEVTAIEPSPDYCRRMARLAERLSVNLDIWNTVAESMEAVHGTFDLAIFSATLHHCDDPEIALRNVHRLLAQGGLLLVVNEPALKPHRSKAQFYRQLEVAPLSMGHYGGNEHIYRQGEYVRMLQHAGFTVREDLHVRYLAPRSAVMDMLERSIDGVHVYSDGAVLARFAAFLLLRRMLRLPILGRVLARLLGRLSLLTLSFVCTKQ